MLRKRSGKEKSMKDKQKLLEGIDLLEGEDYTEETLNELTNGKEEGEE